MPLPDRPKGFDDLLPDDVPRYEHVIGSFRRVAEAAGFREIRTPLLEDLGLFQRSLGEVTDVVQKEMFTVPRQEETLALRPEGTASVVRAYLAASLHKTAPFQKLYYAGPMFRAEQPQSGRRRQFDQCGVEALGSSSPLLDAEVMAVAVRSFEAMGLRNVELRVNSIGDAGDREVFRAALTEHMRAHLGARCDDCKERFTRNVFRMLDCKVPGCQPSNASAPRFLDHLGATSRARFDATLAGLTALGVEHAVDHGIVRGFDYYTHTVFELLCRDVGARSAVCGGGRYDTLISDGGGPELGATGFAIGVIPTLVALEKQGHPKAQRGEPGIDAFVAAVTEGERLPAFRLADRLRGAGLGADCDFEDKKLKAQFKQADRRGARLVVILGPEEVANGRVKIRDLRAGEDLELPDDAALPAALAARLCAPPRADGS
ncbi:MAG: histidine--tRNA ligase [Planctomycetes bacterium]|nr:histidine--tRNA ligase [Planctomycetota bacterium]